MDNLVHIFKCSAYRIYYPNNRHTYIEKCSNEIVKGHETYVETIDQQMTQILCPECLYFLKNKQKDLTITC